MSANPILDTWTTAWSQGLSVASSMTRAWLDGAQTTLASVQGRSSPAYTFSLPATNPWTANPWAAWLSLPDRAPPIGAWGLPAMGLPTGGWSNPWGPLGAMVMPGAWPLPGGASPALAAFSGLQTMFSLMMAPWGGSLARSSDVPWPWSQAAAMTAHLMPTMMAGHGSRTGPSAWLGQWPFLGQTGTLPGWPTMIGMPGAGADAVQAPADSFRQLWPWNMLTAWTSAMATQNSRSPRSDAADADPMGLGQAMRLWTEFLQPGGRDRRSGSSGKQAVAPDTTSDLTKYFPWMAMFR